jgi:hypothetical protein
MNIEEEIYNAKMEIHKREAFLDLPVEFMEFIESIAYDRGHSAGQGEVDGIAISMANDFKPYLARYIARINYGHLNRINP